MTAPGTEPRGAAYAQLLVYRFGPGGGFQGHLMGALERIETGGAVTVLDLLVVGSDAETGERFAVDMPRGGAGGIVAPLLGFRLDAAERRRLTRRALAAGGPRAELAARLGDGLPPGETAIALLVGHDWARTLDEAVGRSGGSEVGNAFVAPRSLAELADHVVEAALGDGRAAPS